MTIERIPLDQYETLGLQPTNVFGSEGFLELNRLRADEIFLLVADRRLAVVCGLKDGILCMPWSAPYMTLLTDGNADEADFRLFGQEARKSLGEDRKFKITVPAPIYGDAEKHFAEGFLRQGDRTVADTSFHISLERAVGEETWNRNQRRNLRRALEEGLALESAGIDECYYIIERHHLEHGYRMAMSRQAVHDTARILAAEFFIVRKDQLPVAAAFCYFVRPDIVQVINSGDTAEGRNYGAMTFLARSLIDRYRKLLVEDKGIKDAVLDYGPTSVDGIQNEGLVRFKTGIGCELTQKYTIKNV